MQKPHLISKTVFIKIITAFVDEANEAMLKMESEEQDFDAFRERTINMIREAAEEAGVSKDEAETSEVMDLANHEPWAIIHINALRHILDRLSELTNTPIFVDDPAAVVSVDRFDNGVRVERRPVTDTEVDKIVENSMSDLEGFLNNVLSNSHDNDDSVS